MNNEENCIYCKADNPKWAKAHVVPRLMGTFKNQPTLLNRVCADCDREIGECEALLSKCSIEGVLLKHIGIIGRHKNRSSSPFRRGHSGHPPIRMTTALPDYDHEVRVEPIGDSSNVDILPQLVLIDAQGRREELAISNPDCISLNELTLLMRKCLDCKINALEAIGISNEQFDLIKYLFQKFGITFDPADDIKISPFQAQVPVKGSVVYDERYFRALAKVAFHYYLVHSKMFSGAEPEFGKIREYIRHGKGDKNGLIRKGNQALAYDPSDMDRPPYYGHILRTEITSSAISVYIQLFIGHDYIPDWHQVILSQEKRKIFLQTEEFGHYYKYYEPDKRSQYDGDIEKLTVAQILQFPGLSNN